LDPCSLDTFDPFTSHKCIAITKFITLNVHLLLQISVDTQRSMPPTTTKVNYNLPKVHSMYLSSWYQGIFNYSMIQNISHSFLWIQNGSSRAGRICCVFPCCLISYLWWWSCIRHPWLSHSLMFYQLSLMILLHHTKYSWAPGHLNFCFSQRACILCWTILPFDQVFMIYFPMVLLVVLWSKIFSICSFPIVASVYSLDMLNKILVKCQRPLAARSHKRLRIFFSVFYKALSFSTSIYYIPLGGSFLP